MATDSKSNNQQTTTTTTGRQQNEPNTDYRIVVFGAAGVGKSSLVVRFVRGTFKDTYVPTIEDTYRQIMASSKLVCTLQITDTTGSHQFPAMQRLNIQKGHAFVLVYSITSRQSLDELKPIYQDIYNVKGSLGHTMMPPIILIGNKCDESSSRDISTALGQQLANEWGCAFMETSAKSNVNVKEAFDELLKLDTRNSQLFNDPKSPADKSQSQSSLSKNAVKKSSKKEKAEKKDDGKKAAAKEASGGKRKCLVM